MLRVRERWVASTKRCSKACSGSRPLRPHLLTQIPALGVCECQAVMPFLFAVHGNNGGIRVGRPSGPSQPSQSPVAYAEMRLDHQRAARVLTLLSFSPASYSAASTLIFSANFVSFWSVCFSSLSVSRRSFSASVWPRILA